MSDLQSVSPTRLYQIALVNPRSLPWGKFVAALGAQIELFMYSADSRRRDRGSA